MAPHDLGVVLYADSAGCREIACSPRGPRRRRRRSSRWSDDQPGHAGKLRAGRRATGVWYKGPEDCL
jgi:hypothetical protein